MEIQKQVGSLDSNGVTKNEGNTLCGSILHMELTAYGGIGCGQDGKGVSRTVIYQLLRTCWFL